MNTKEIVGPGPAVSTTSVITAANRWDHLLARVGFQRGSHRVRPGMYALGAPTPESPVFVTANYTLSFDALRSSLAGVDGHILVLDTEGINVWCAAGKGTFGTDELVRQIEATVLHLAVTHRTLILPQLGAPGVSAHEVRARSGFDVEYGPVRAADLPEYLKTRKATPEMRRVRFDLADRLVLIPVELSFALFPLLVAAAVLFFLLGPVASAAAVAAVLAGVALFPVILPWIPGSDFSSKGFILGGVVALPFAVSAVTAHPAAPLWQQAAGALVYMLALPPATAFTALNFTGSTTYTSWSQVRREILTYVPKMGLSFGGGILLLAALFLAQKVGGL